MTLQKDKISEEQVKRRINVKKIVSLEEVINQRYSEVTIELNKDYKIEEIKKILSGSGQTKINLVINDKNKKASYSLQNNRKFDLSHLKALKAKEYVAKIIV